MQNFHSKIKELFIILDLLKYWKRRIGERYLNLCTGLVAFKTVSTSVCLRYSIIESKYSTFNHIKLSPVLLSFFKLSKLTYFGQGEAYEKKRKEMLVKLIWQGKISKSHFEPSSWICFQKIYLISAYGFWEENFYKDFPYISPGNQGMYFFTKY